MMKASSTIDGRYQSPWLGDEFSTNHRANSEAVVAAVVVIPVSIATVEAQAVGVLPTTSAKRTRPIATDIAYVLDTATVTEASSREE